jgi:hypothetical protein
VPLVVLFVLSSDVVDLPLTVVPVESLPRVSPLVSFSSSVLCGRPLESSSRSPFC